MTANRNGGCPEGQTADATGAVQGTTTAYPEDSQLRALREADENAYSESYVIAEVPGDVAVPQSYVTRWRWALGVAQ